VPSYKTLESGGLTITGSNLPYNRRLIERARQLRRHMTPAESRLWYRFLQTFEYPVLRQRPIDHYIVDFYCARLKLVIEIDGETHYTEDGKVYDEKRTQVLEGYGLRVLRFTNEEVERNLESVCQRILEVAQESPPTPPCQGG
jgi:very-short-patch-repair endonuclease